MLSASRATNQAQQDPRNSKARGVPRASDDTSRTHRVVQSARQCSIQPGFDEDLRSRGWGSFIDSVIFLDSAAEVSGKPKEGACIPL